MMNKRIRFLNFLIYILIAFSCGLGNKDEDLLKTGQKKINKINYKKFIIPDDKINKTVVISFTEDIDNFNPYLPEKEIDRFFVNSILSSLFYLNPETGLPEKNLIENYNCSYDKLTYYFNLRDNIKFHDNSGLTAYDVQASLSLLNDILKNSKIYNEFYALNSAMNVDVLSALEFTVKTDVPNGNLIYALCNYPIMKKNQIESVIADYKPENNNLNLIKIDGLIGSGPFYLKKTEDDYYELKKNNDYFKKDPNGISIPCSERLIIKIINEKDININYLKKNKIDIIGLNDKQFDEFYKSGKVNVSDKYKIIDTEESQNGIYMAFNMYKDNRYGYISKVNLRKHIYENLMEQITGKNKNKKKLKEKLAEKNNEFNKIFKKNFADENRITLRILIYDEGKRLTELAGLIQNIFAGNPQFEIKTDKVNYVNFIEKILDKDDFDITLFYYNAQPGPLSYLNLFRNNLCLINFDEEKDILSNKIKTFLPEIINETEIEDQKEKITVLKNTLENNYQYVKIYSPDKYYIISGNLKNFKVKSSLEENINLETIESVFMTNGKK